jgi:hypothetical protein
MNLIEAVKSGKPFRRERDKSLNLLIAESIGLRFTVLGVSV